MTKIGLLKIFISTAFLSMIICFSVFLFLKKQNLEESFLRRKNLHVSARILSNNEFNSNFGGFNYFKNRDIRNKYKALKIDIKNDNDNEYLLERDGLNLEFEQPLEIGKKLKTNFALAPLAVAGAVSALFILSFGLAVIPSVITGTAIGASTNLINVKESNRKMSENIKNLSHDLIHGVVIPAHETISRIFFIKNEKIKDKFNLKLLDPQNNNNLDFPMALGHQKIKI